MNVIRHIKTGLFILLGIVAGNAHAVIVDFEEYGSAGSINLGLSSTFQGATTTPGSRQRLEMVDATGNPFDTFGDTSTGVISFSGAVLLEDPTETGMFPPVGGVPVGSVYYATANAPSTNAIPNPLLEQTITITITDSQVTSVEGILINGLATTMDTALAEYFITYFTDTNMFTERIGPMEGLPSNQENGAALFSIATSGDFINSIEITSPGVQFPGDPDLLEYDFLIDALSFNESLNPIPVPAAFPLFLSALLGGWLLARPRKSSETIH